jgi:RNA polymerase sigma-70 factor (ECF subfamily)
VAALERLLAAQRDVVFRYGLRVCRTTEAAEDAVQETLWVAARNIRSFRGASRFTTWLFAIIRNRCLRWLGRPAHEPLDLAQVLSMPSAAPGPEREAERREVEQLLARALQALEPTHRQVLLARDVEGLTAPEVAHRLGVSVAAVKSRLHRAREALRDRVIADDLT